jgi:DNA-binding beta-propeller fold protein YncE
MRSLLILFSSAFLACAQQSEPLRQVGAVALPGVEGRIDHLSVDLNNQRLFVAALGNNTVEIIDLKNGKRFHSIPGLAEPQGVLYVPRVDRLYVANAGDGSLRIFDGSSFQLVKSTAFGDDADNLRDDSGDNQIWVGYGSGALGAVDKDGGKIADIKLDAHPESFQLEKNGGRIFVNLPRSKKIAVIDRKTKSVVASWATGGPQANFPMALDEANHRLIVVCRTPARMVVLDTASGKVIASIPTVGDCDDVFYDQGRKRIYATGGEGAISVVQQQDADHYKEIAKISTVKGARTGFFSPELDRLFVAVRKQGSQSAEIRIYELK